MTRTDALETCLRQVADDMDTGAAKFRRLAVLVPWEPRAEIQMAEMLEQSAAAAREVATDKGGGQ